MEMALDDFTFERLRGNADIVPFPDMALDSSVSFTDAPTKLAFKAIRFVDQDVDDVVSNQNSWREVVNYFGRLNAPGFDADNFDMYAA